MGQVDEPFNNIFDLSKLENQRFIMCILAWMSKERPIVVPLKDLEQYFADPGWTVSYDLVKFNNDLLDGTITITSRHG